MCVGSESHGKYDVYDNGMQFLKCDYAMNAAVNAQQYASFVFSTLAMNLAKYDRW